MSEAFFSLCFFFFIITYKQEYNIQSVIKMYTIVNMGEGVQVIQGWTARLKGGPTTYLCRCNYKTEYKILIPTIAVIKFIKTNYL